MVNLSTQAQIAIRSLLPVDRERVEHRIALLERFPGDSYVRQQSTRLKNLADDNLYIMRVSPQLRLLFRYSNNNIEIIDVVPHDRLARMGRFDA